jgi:hypothetical protein
MDVAGNTLDVARMHMQEVRRLINEASQLAQAGANDSGLHSVISSSVLQSQQYTRTMQDISAALDMIRRQLERRASQSTAQRRIEQLRLLRERQESAMEEIEAANTAMHQFIEDFGTRRDRRMAPRAREIFERRQRARAAEVQGEAGPSNVSLSPEEQRARYVAEQTSLDAHDLASPDKEEY